MREERGEWREVGGKGKILKTKIQHPDTTGYRNYPANTTTFYITNFPDNVNATDLWKSFSRYWTVGEVYIPAKTDRQGKRFGFARFADVDDVQSLLEKIEGTWIGTFKIRANISRFKRGDVGEDLATKPVGTEIAIRQGEEVREQVESTFKHVLVMGGKKQPTVIDVGGKQTIFNSPIVPEVQHHGMIEVEAVQSNIQRLNQCFVGFLKEEVEPDKLQMLIAMEGFQHIQAAPLGVDIFLLSSPQQDGVKKALTANREWWNRWFSEIKCWHPDLIPVGRRVWVRIFGVPPQAWGVDCFSKVVKQVGNLIKLDSQTKNHTRLDVARVLIVQHSWSSIDVVEEVKMKDQRFLVRMVEERVGDIDLRLNRLGSSHSSDGCSSRSSIKGWQRDAAATGSVGWNDGGSVGDSGDDGLFDPLCNNRLKLPIVSDFVTEERGLNNLVTVTDPKKVDVGEINLTNIVVLSNNKGEEFQITSQNMEGVQYFGPILEEVGMEQEVVRRCQEGVLTCEEEESGRLQKKGLCEENEVGSLSTSQVPIGPSTLGPNFLLDKGKGIMEFSNKGGVNLSCFPLLNGGCSLGPVGPNYPHLDLELCCVNRLKDKQIGFLAWQESLLTSSCPSGNVSNLVKDFKTGRKEGDGKKKSAAEFGGLTKCERFAKAVRGGKGARKGRKKGRKIATILENGEQEDSISNGSQDCVDLRPKGKRLSIPISALQVVLTEGYSNRVHDAESEAYRIEAERLFNIGLNLGCTTNEERISMIERLVDLEEKEGVVVEVLEDEEVDQ
jgi:hypothetical protein